MTEYKVPGRAEHMQGCLCFETNQFICITVSAEGVLTVTQRHWLCVKAKAAHA